MVNCFEIGFFVLYKKYTRSKLIQNNFRIRGAKQSGQDEELESWTISSFTNCKSGRIHFIYLRNTMIIFWILKMHYRWRTKSPLLYTSATYTYTIELTYEHYITVNLGVFLSRFLYCG